MKDVIDRFGEGITTNVIDNNSFIAEIEVSVSQTFFAWVVAFAGKIKIVGPGKVEDDFLKHIKAVGLQELE
jgi:hypothetical protein